MNPDNSLMYDAKAPDYAWAEGAQQGNIQMPLRPGCKAPTWWECPAHLVDNVVCGVCGVSAKDAMRAEATSRTSGEQSILGAKVANILTAAARGEDMVNLPAHYARFKIEPMFFIAENGLNWFQGNILKYILRHDAKDGLQDLRKARRYLDMFIKWVEGDVDWWKREEAA